MSLAGLWSGIAWGDYSGGLTVELLTNVSHVSGELLLSEPGAGQTRAKVSGTAANGRLHLALDSFTSDFPSEQVELPSHGDLDGNFDLGRGYIDGVWKTDRGTSGKFVVTRSLAHPLGIPSAVPAQPPSLIAPAQPIARVPPLHNRTDTLGSYRLDREDLMGLAEVVRTNTNVLLPAVNITSEGRGYIHVGMDSALADLSLPDVVHEMFVSANEGIINAGHKIVALTFKKQGPNTLFVSDYDRTWVEGKATELIQFLKSRESKAARFLAKYGPSINGVVFLVLLAFLPSIPSLRERLYVVAATFALLFTLVYGWRAAVCFKGYLRKEKLPWYRKYEGIWLSVVSVLLTALVGYLLNRFTHR